MSVTLPVQGITQLTVPAHALPTSAPIGHCGLAIPPPQCQLPSLQRTHCTPESSHALDPTFGGEALSEVLASLDVVAPSGWLGPAASLDSVEATAPPHDARPRRARTIFFSMFPQLGLEDAAEHPTALAGRRSPKVTCFIASMSCFSPTSPSHPYRNFPSTEATQPRRDSAVNGRRVPFSGRAFSYYEMSTSFQNEYFFRASGLLVTTAHSADLRAPITGRLWMQLHAIALVFEALVVNRLTCRCGPHAVRKAVSIIERFICTDSNLDNLRRGEPYARRRH
jgi:hypothetical protein